MSADRGDFSARPAAGLSLAAVGATIILMLMGGGPPREPAAGAAIMFGFCCCLVGTACFFVCRKYPRSAPYVLILGNALGVIVLVIEPAITKHGEWAFLTVVWFVAVLTVLATMSRGRRREDRP